MSIMRPTTQQPQPPGPPLNQPPLPPGPPPSQNIRYDLDLTIISAKHLKNVNWKNGGSLKPYAIFWVDPDQKLTTKSDDSSGTKPVWNQRFTLPIPITTPLHDAVFTLELFHSRASETPKPFVGSLQVRLSSLPDPDDSNKLRTYDLIRPSGRPQGKIKLKLALKQQPFVGFDYQNVLPNSYYYSSTAPSSIHFPSASPYPYPTGYYTGYYPPSPSPPRVPSVLRSFSERSMVYGAPSAPVDYSPNDVRTRPMGTGGFGAGLGIGALGGMMGGLALDEEKHNGERVEDNYLGGASSAKDDFSEYHAEY